MKIVSIITSRVKTAFTYVCKTIRYLYDSTNLEDCIYLND